MARTISPTERDERSSVRLTDRTAYAVDRREPQALVQRCRWVVRFDAEAERGQSQPLRLGDQRLHEQGADSPSARSLNNADRQLRRPLVDEPVPGIALSEQSPPRRSDCGRSIDGNPTEIARSRPVGDVVRELRSGQEFGDRPHRRIRTPVRRNCQHLLQERRVGGGRPASNDHGQIVAPIRHRGGSRTATGGLRCFAWNAAERSPASATHRSCG